MEEYLLSLLGGLNVIAPLNSGLNAGFFSQGRKEIIDMEHFHVMQALQVGLGACTPRKTRCSETEFYCSNHSMLTTQKEHTCEYRRCYYIAGRC